MSTMHEGPRFTLRGSKNIERHIGTTIARAAATVAQHFHPHERRALVLFGGYGRGEGGAFYDKGQELPHNNIDLILVTSIRGSLSRRSIKKRLDDVLAPLSRDGEIGIDTGVISEFELRRAPARVIWFDLRWGHRTILGDAALIPSLSPLRAADIEIEDIHDLLVNRASLLIINDAILDQGLTSDFHARFLVKHLMKAILGHGDALLFTRGRYHASYVEKQRRIRELSNIVPGLSELYNMAAEFRYSPDYSKYSSRSLELFAPNVRQVLARAYLEFERHRSRSRHCTFLDHIDRVLLAKPSGMTIASRFRNVMVNGKTFLAARNVNSLSGTATIALRHYSPRTILAATLPIVLFGSTADQMQLASTVLGSRDNEPKALRQAYLRHWSAHGDPNFRAAAQRLGLSLESTGGSQ